MKISEKVSILVPVYNIENKIKDNILYLKKSVSSFLLDYEIVLSDDGSKDNTLSKLIELEKEHDNIIVVYSEINQGKGHALKRASEKASGEYIVFCDGDMEIEPRHIELFFEIMQKENADVVIGSKRHKDSKVNYSLIRKVISFIYFMFVKIFFNLPIKDTQTGLKLFKRSAIINVFQRILVKAFAYDLEVLVACNLNNKKIVSAPVIVNPNRNFGFIPLKVLFSTFIDTIAIFYRLNFLKFYYNLFDERKDEPLISIIIPLKKINDYIVEATNAILKQTYQNFELIILSDDYTEKELENNIFRDKKIIIKSTGNIPPAKKRDIGVKLSKGKILSFIDDDTYPEVNWLNNAIRAMEGYNVEALGGPATNTERDNFFKQVSGIIYSSRLMSGKYIFRYIPQKVQYVYDYPSCNFFVSRELYYKAGGFNSDYWPGEDTIICNNILKQGKKILYSPEVLVYHHRREFFMGHYKQLRGYGWHRGYFARNIGGNSLHISYFIPSIFTLYFILYFPFFILINNYKNILPIDYKILSIIISIPNMLYFTLLLFSTFSTFSIAKGVFKFIGIFASHIIYGLYFFAGFFSKKKINV